MIANKAHAQLALLCQEAEDMYVPGLLNPELPLVNWRLIRHIVGEDKLPLISDKQYYGFLAVSTSDPMQYVVVMRGTENLLEWLEDGDAELVTGPPIGKVERGFWDIYQSLTIDSAIGPPISSAQWISSNLPDGATLTVIGHSLGAALGTYLLYDIVISIPKFEVSGVFFASPRTGNQAFTQAVGTLCTYTSYAFIRDLVPHLPLTMMCFSSLPGTLWIKPSESQAVMENTPACNHDARSYAKALDYDCFSGETTCVLGRNA